jgi:NADPH:quinone reductase-like Zn-dependent oxidoreductase
MALDRRSFLKVTTAAVGALALDALPLEGAICKSSLIGAGKGTSDALVMRGVLVREFGPPEVLRIEEVPRPVPADGEILVKVQAAAVNPVDAIVRTGGWNIPTPLIPGFDLSGVVAAVGPGVTDYRIGDEVFALLDLQRGGAYAEYAVVRVDEAARKPGRTSHAGAASLPLVALTGWQALFDTAGLRTGQSILIHAGAGGVGSTAIQLAKWRGATVYATASEANHAYMRGLGADVTIDYRTERFEDIAKNVDVVLDPIAGSTQVRSLDVLREGGILVSLNGLTGPARNPPRNVRAEAILVRPDSDQLNQVGQLLDGGFLRPTVSHLLPLEEAADAHTQIETGRTRGKIVLQVEGDPDGVGRGRDRGLLGTG